MKSVAILLSTYNGEKYLKKLLNSIVNQDYDNYHIYIRDDGSIDNTLKIILDFHKNYLNKITVSKDDFGNIGFNKSFETLLLIVDSDIYFFCDQDDIWKPDKISTMVEIITNNDENYIPKLAFSDMFLIDSKDQIFNKSYLKKVKYKIKNPTNVLISGGVPGCSMCFNNALKLKYIDYRGDLLYHDSRIYLLALFFGKIIKINKKLVSYRIHSDNAIGLGKKDPFILTIKDFLKYFTNSSGFRSLYLKDYCKRIEVLRHEELYNCFDKNILLSKKKIDSLSFLKRKKWFYKYYLNKKVDSFANFLRLIIF